MIRVGDKVRNKFNSNEFIWDELSHTVHPVENYEVASRPIYFTPDDVVSLELTLKSLIKTCGYSHQDTLFITQLLEKARA